MGCTQLKSKKQHTFEQLDTNMSIYGSQRAFPKFIVSNEQRKEKFQIHLNPIMKRRSLQNKKNSLTKTT